MEEAEREARKDEYELQQFEALGFGKQRFWESEKSRHQNHLRLVERLEEKQAKSAGKNKGVEEKSVKIQNEVSMVTEINPGRIDEEELLKGSTYLDDLLTVYARKVLKARYHGHFVSMCIVAHALAMGANQYDAPPEWKRFALVANIVFNVVFAFELFLRICAAESARFDGLGFFSDKSNLFETIMVVAGVFGILLNLQLPVEILKIQLSSQIATQTTIRLTFEDF